MPSLQRPVHPQVRQGREASRGSPSGKNLWSSRGSSGVPLEGRHSAFPRAARRAQPFAKKAPVGAREGRMPSLQRPIPKRSDRAARRAEAPQEGKPLVKSGVKWGSSGGKAFCLPSRRQARTTVCQEGACRRQGRQNAFPPKAHPQKVRQGREASRGSPRGQPLVKSGVKWGFLWREGILPSLAPPGALKPLAKKAPIGAREGRMPSLQRPVPKVRQGREASRGSPRGKTSGQVGGQAGIPLEGRHSAFPRAVRRAQPFAKKAPVGAREGRMPSLQRPIPKVRHRDARRAEAPREGKPLVKSGVKWGFLWREGILPSLAPPGALDRLPRRRLSAPGKAECLPSKGPSIPAPRGGARQSISSAHACVGCVVEAGVCFRVGVADVNGVVRGRGVVAVAAQ